MNEACCRLCLRTGPHDVRDIFEDELLRKISTFSDVQIKASDELPKTICKTCHDSVNAFHEFKCRIEKSDRDLRQALLKNKSKVYWPRVLIEKYDEDCCSSSNGAGKENNDHNNLNDKNSIKIQIKIDDADQSDDDKPLVLRTKRHKCRHCIKSFANLTQLEKHAVVHKKQQRSQTTTYVCYLCDAIFSDFEKIKDHATEAHGFDIDRQNSELESSSSSSKSSDGDSEDSQESFGRYKKYSCKFCGRLFVYYKSFLAHLENHPNDYSRLFSNLSKSPKVLETAKRILNLNKFTSSESTSSDDKSASSLDLSADEVKRKVDPEVKSVTSESNDSTNDSSSGDNDNNNNEKCMTCNECGKAFSSRRGIITHLAVHNGGTCLNCEKHFSSVEKLEAHQRLNVNGSCNKLDPNNISLNGVTTKTIKKKIKRQLRPHKCTTCNKAFAELLSLENHMQRHKFPKRYLCEVCSKIFNQSSSLIAHMRIHTGAKPYVCNICSRAFAKNTYLQLHLRTHSGEKPYSCKYCEKTFARANTLARHITMHTGEAKYECKICSKSYRRLASLHEHTYTHTGQRPYSCKYCAKKFNNAGSLYAHKKKCQTRCPKTPESVPTPSPEPLQPIENSLLFPQDDNIFLRDSSSQMLIFSDDKVDELITDQVMAMESSYQFTITNLQNAVPVNVLESFPIQESDIFNILTVV